MRLFVAINFNSEVKEYLSRTIQSLKREVIRGNFTRIQNMHLTLAFLGEVSSDRVSELLRILNESIAGQESFSIRLEGIGHFPTREEKLYWCGIRENEALNRLQHTLITNLQQNGFAVDAKKFKPHITIARRCIMKDGFVETRFAERMEPVSMRVNAISLMQSETKNGILTYTDLGDAFLE